MALKKEYSKNKKICKVTFTLPKELGDNFDKISLVGDFNNWDPDANLFSENSESGDYTVSIQLSGGIYHFKYLADDVQWFNEDEADAEEVNDFGTKNSVIRI